MPVNHSTPPQMHLHPQHTAQTLHELCQHVPVWPYGAIGSTHALRLLAAALGQPQTAAAGHTLALYAWGQAPFDSQLLHIVRHLYTQRWGGAAHGPAKAAASSGPALAEYLALRPAQPDPGHPCEILITARHKAQALVENDPAAAATAEALHALSQLLPPLDRHPAQPPHPPHPPHPWSLWCNSALAQYHYLQGHIAAAREALWPVWEHCPLHPNLILALYELSYGLPAQNTAPAPLQHAPALLLYSWNKAEVLAQTLTSLRHSHTDYAPIFVLNNGSSDDTAALLRAAADQWGEQLHCLHLPVNIGAPAARNWLLALPEVRAHDTVIFLDDDILLDKDWLRSLCAVADAHPEADTIGCRIVGHLPPHVVQCADFFLLPPEGGDTSFVDIEENMHLHCAAMGSMDTLLTLYTRPCLSVSGCCHLLRTRHVLAQGGFDIRFSPSQFDDAERDMRTVLHGGQVLYTGLVSVKHVQHSSLQQAHSRARVAHIFGNKLKLEFLYDAKKAATIRQNLAPRVLHDLIRKCTRLASLAATERV